jgi:hypothetical protein
MRSIAPLSVAALISIASCSQLAPTVSSGTSSPKPSAAEVKQRLEQKGYTDVKNVQPYFNGAWTANATVEGRPGFLSISPDGKVTATHALDINVRKLPDLW